MSVLFGIFAGVSATGKWRTFLLWQHRQSFGKADPYFHKDIGFYFFSLPWLHYLVDFAITALVIGLLAAVLVHYLYGGIRLQARRPGLRRRPGAGLGAARVSCCCSRAATTGSTGST